jgi:nicotinate-nucleotide pyrophosphorylase (carboxylating)
MIKDNHVDANGGNIAQTIQKIADYKKAYPATANFGLTLEVRNLAEVQAALDSGKGIVTRLMLDNFTPILMKKAVALINGQFEVEASGGVTIKNLRRIALTGVDYISSGALTHSVISLDLSLKVVKSF